MPDDTLKTVGLVAGYIISVVALALLALVAGDGTRATVVSLLSTIAVASAATLGVMHIGGMFASAMSNKQATVTTISTTTPAVAGSEGVTPNGSDTTESSNSINGSSAV